MDNPIRFCKCGKIVIHKHSCRCVECRVKYMKRALALLTQEEKALLIEKIQK